MTPRRKPASLRRSSPGRRPARARGRRLRILITAGPTREYFDSVRFISNPSSGKMGYAIAAAAAAAGHEVTLISGPLDLPPPKGVRTIRVVSAAEMARATKPVFAKCDAAVFAAAVCDYRPRRRAALKRPKRTAVFAVELVPTEDIAAACGRGKRGQLMIAFALEDHDARRHAEGKLLRKNCDAIVLNDPRTVGADRAVVEFLVRGETWERWPALSKERLAARLVRRIERLSASAPQSSDRPKR